MNGNKLADAPSTSVKPRNNDLENRKPVNGSSPRTDVRETNGIKSSDDAESEAETLITSPVKQREAANKIKKEVDAASKIVDEDVDAPGSPEDGVPLDAQLNEVMLDDSSDALSVMSVDSSSRESSRSRGQDSKEQSSNPRKRKHRASSVSLPNKRRSVDGTARRLRGLPTGESLGGRSESPRARTHRRAASTQSFINDGDGIKSKRRGPVSGDLRSSNWDNSSISSEGTSLGDQKRPQRGIGRSTSGAGRPPGRELKRHVNKYGFTKLAEACEDGDVRTVKECRERDPEALEVAEFAGNKPLQIAALNGNADVVEYLINEGCQVDCANVDKDTPLIDAAENGHVDVVGILLRAGVDPLRQNLKGQQALDVVSDETDNAADIRALLRTAIETWNSDDAKQRREEEEEQRYRAGPAQKLHFMARTYDNLVQLVQNNDRTGVREFLDARVPVDNAVIAAAAKTGDLYLMNMLLAEMPDKKRLQKPEKPMLSVLGTSHFDMVKSLTELDQFDPLWTNRQGKRWSKIAEEKSGPMWRQEMELLQRLEKEADDKEGDRRSSSPILRRDLSNKHNHLNTHKEDEEEDDSSDEEMAEDETPRRKNGKRLLSRRSMQAVVSGGGGGSRRTSNESGGDSEEDRIINRSQEAPKEKRGPGRPRTKGVVVVKHEEITSNNADARRRRSSSTKQMTEKALPIVEEATALEMDKDALEASNRAAEAVRLQREEEERTRTQQQRQEEERQQQAAQRQLEMDLERQRQADEAARQREIEIEKERQRQLDMAAMDAARSKIRQQLIDVLPEPISWMLDPKSDFSYDDQHALATLLDHCSPLQVVYASDMNVTTSFAGPLVLNLAVAPLLGKGVGLQLLLPEDAIDPSVLDMLIAQEFLPGIIVEERHKIQIDRLLLPSKLITSAHQHSMIDAIDDTFTNEVARSFSTHQARVTAAKQLHLQPLVLRWLSLQHVVNMLHPVLQDLDISVREEWRNPLRQSNPHHASKSLDETDFFHEVCKHWEEAQLSYTCRHAQDVKTSAERMYRAKSVADVLLVK